jgi:hypothetical protein
MGIKYTWDYWHPNASTSWQDHRPNVAESPRMQLLLNKLEACLDEHSAKQDYEACLGPKR